MALTNGQLAELAAELTSDPKGLGYASSDDPTCADLLNTVGLSKETLPNVAVSTIDVLDCIDMTEIGSIPVNKMQFFHARMQPGITHDISTGSIVRDQVLNIFAGCTETLSALASLQTRDCSRAEALFGAGVVVTYMDVGRARTGDY